MKQDSKRLTSILIAALLLAGALVVYFSFIVPAYGNLETLKGQMQSESTLYANENQIVTKANNLLASYQNNSSSVAEVSLALPIGPNIADALAQIYGIASSAGFTVQSAAVATQAVTPAQQQSSAAAQGGGQVANAASTGAVVMPTGAVTFQLSGMGTYESFKSFLQGLETNIRVFDVTGISLQPLSSGNPVSTGKGAPAASADNFNFTITAVTYYQAS